jgi:hypothetical protein
MRRANMDHRVKPGGDELRNEPRKQIVIASGAKRSRRKTEELDCFVAIAPRNDDLSINRSVLTQEKRGAMAELVYAAPLLATSRPITHKVSV